MHSLFKSIGISAVLTVIAIFSFTGLAQTPRSAPNVIYLVLDDVGFADLGCYGSEIKTPNIDRLAANGLRYNNFHTTALCSPTRATLFVNDKQVGAGMIPRTLPFLISWEGFDIGCDSLSPVSLRYEDKGEFPFTGKLNKVVLEIR